LERSRIFIIFVGRHVRHPEEDETREAEEEEAGAIAAGAYENG